MPVTLRTWAMPCESRRMTPICDGVSPFFDILQIWSHTSDGSRLSQLGGARRYGMAEADMPLPLLCMRPMVAAECEGGYYPTA